jgi:SAM-dependent methyltransferase
MAINAPPEMDTDKEIQFFDQFAEQHGEYDVLAEESYQRIIEVLKSEVPRQPALRGVDLGCGTGAFTRRLSHCGYQLTGVDVSPRSIARARELGGAEYVTGDINSCPLPAASFDLAVMSGVLHHIPTEAERIQCLREAFRLLRPGGSFFSYDPNAHSPSMFLYRDHRSPLHSKDGKTDNEVLLSRRQIAGYLSSVGFTQVRAYGVSGIAYRYVAGRVASKLLPFYNRVYEPLIRWSPFEKTLGTFVVAIATKPLSATAQP